MVQAIPNSGPVTEGGITAQTRVNLKRLEPVEESRNRNPKIRNGNVRNVHLCKDPVTGDTELASFDGEMSTDCTVEEHESIREYRERPEVDSVGKAARSYLLSKKKPGALHAEVRVTAFLG